MRLLHTYRVHSDTTLHTQRVHNLIMSDLLTKYAFKNS